MKDLIHQLEAERDALLAQWKLKRQPGPRRQRQLPGAGRRISAGWPRVANLTADNPVIDERPERTDVWWGRLRHWVPTWPF